MGGGGVTFGAAGHLLLLDLQFLGFVTWVWVGGWVGGWVGDRSCSLVSCLGWVGGWFALPSSKIMHPLNSSFPMLVAHLMSCAKRVLSLFFVCFPREAGLGWVGGWVG